MPNLRPIARIDVEGLIRSVLLDLELVRFLAVSGRRTAVIAAVAAQRSCTDAAVSDFLLTLAGDGVAS